MKKVVVLYKNEGETPLMALENFRKKNPEYKNAPMTYAGRLDPMASGVLVVLAGDKTKEKEKYLALNKQYDFSVLFGFRTDTHDILGKVLKADYKTLEKYPVAQNFSVAIENGLKEFVGKIVQKYPAYSSKTVNGKPLFAYARQGEAVETPEREIFIEKISLEKVRKIDSQKLLADIEKRIKKVQGDFRQKEIIKIWQKKLAGQKKMFYIADFKIKCTSGTYVRKIADELGEKINIPALAFCIKRTKVGRFGFN